ncbi:MAG: hypothetical protein R2757_13865 [Draconibacterium sp.]
MIEKLIAKSRITEGNTASMCIIGAYKKATLNTDVYFAAVMLSLEEQSNLLTQSINRMKTESDLGKRDELRDNVLQSVYFLVVPKCLKEVRFLRYFVCSD